MPIAQSARWTFRASSGPHDASAVWTGIRRVRLVVLNASLDAIDEHSSVACDDLEGRSRARSEQRWGVTANDDWRTTTDERPERTRASLRGGPAVRSVPA
jgi:hypothetical protein